MKEFFEKVDFEKNQQTTNKHEKFPRGQKVNKILLFIPTGTAAIKVGLKTLMSPLLPFFILLD